MLRRFVLTLMSSWVMNPLGVLVAQWFGIANSNVVILVLLATGACVPFQLFMNECMAASAERGTTALTKVQIALVLMIQSVACSFVLLVLSSHDFHAAQVLLIIVGLAFNTLNSYYISRKYFDLVVRDKVPLHFAIIIGAMPGFTNLTLYLLFCAATFWLAPLAAIIIISSSFLPSIAQMAYLQWFASKSKFEETDLKRSTSPRVSNAWLLAALLSLTAMASIAAHLRETVALLSVVHIALLLVTLNAMQSLINTLTRAAYLSQSVNNFQRILLLSSLAALGLMFFTYLVGWKISPLIGLLAAQIATSWVIEASRNIPASMTHFNKSVI